MEYQLTITATSTEELQSIIDALNGGGETAAAPATKKKKPAPKPEPEEEPEEEAEEEVEEDDLTGEDVTIDTLRAKISALAQDGKRDAVKKVLTKHKANTLKDVAAGSYEAFNADLDKIK